MMAHGFRCTKFQFHFRNIEFSIIYVNDCRPQELLFGARHHNIFFKIAVYDDYKIYPIILDSALFAIRDAIRVNVVSTERLLSKPILEAFSAIIPEEALPTRVPSPEEILSTSRDVEDESKVYFVTWILHRNPAERDVTDENLAKTRRACGEEFYRYCKEYRISSKWTDVESDRKILTHPSSVV